MTQKTLGILLTLLVIGFVPVAFVITAALAEDDAKPQRLRGSVDDLTARVEALEQRCQSLSDPKPAYHGNVIQAERFEVLNATGKVVGVLGSLSAGSVAFALLDTKGNPRIAIAVGQDGNASMEFADEKLTTRLSLGVTDPTEPANSAKAVGLAVWNPAGQKTIDLTTIGPHSTLKFYDTNDAYRVMVGVSDTLPIISSWDSAGKLMWFAPASE